MRHPRASHGPVRPRREAGFTLIELLIAVSILAIGLLGIVKLQMQSGMGNTSARHITAAVNLTRSKIEEIRRVKEYYVPRGGGATVVGALLSNDGSNTDLGNWTSPDHTATGTLNEAGSYGGIYSLAWNVADNLPEANMKTIRVRVTWMEGSQNKAVVMETQVARKNLDYYQ